MKCFQDNLAFSVIQMKDSESTYLSSYKKVLDELEKICGDKTLNDNEVDVLSVGFLYFAPFLIPNLIVGLPTKKSMNQLIFDLKKYSATKEGNNDYSYDSARKLIIELAEFISENGRNNNGDKFEKGAEG